MEISGDDAKLQELVDAGKLRTYPFENREATISLAEPVKADWAEEIGAISILNAINAL